MTENGPSLSLFELIHPMSPSPTPQIPESVVATARDGEWAQEEEMSSMDLEGLVGSGESSEREKELARMILKLTTTRPQIVSQAEVISALTLQRDLIIKQAEEDRARFDAERDGWDRMAEALIAQGQNQNRVLPLADSEKTEQLERQCAAFQSDNKFLRDKLNDALSRLSCLESELAKLRPILLMQPTTSTTPAPKSSQAAYLSAFPYPPMTGASALAMHKARQEKKKSERPREIKVPPPVHFRAQEAEEGRVGEAEEEKETTVINPYTLPTNSGPYAHLRPQTRTANIPTAPTSFLSFSPKRTRNQTRRMHARMPPPSPISSDARNEHLLLAARRIGKERVGVLMGIQREGAGSHYRTQQQQQQQQEKPKSPNGTGPSAPTTHAFTVPMGYHPAASGNTSTGLSPIPYVYIQNTGPGGGAVVIPYPTTTTTTTAAASAGGGRQGSLTKPQPPQQQSQPQPQPQQQQPPQPQPPQPPQPQQQPQPQPQPPQPPAKPLSPLPPLVQKPRLRGKGKQTAQSQVKKQPPPPPSASNGSESTTTTTTATKNPLDSLLDAARKIENVPSSSSPLTRSRRRSGEDDAQAQVQSPSPKRPRIDSAGASSSSGRVRSALDLLADEAASHSPAPPPRLTSSSSSLKESSSGRPVRMRGPPRERRMIENMTTTTTTTRRMSRARMIEPPKAVRKSVREEEEEEEEGKEKEKEEKEKEGEGEKEQQPEAKPPSSPIATPPPHQPTPNDNDADGSTLGDTDADGDDDPDAEGDVDVDVDVEMDPPHPPRIIQPPPVSPTQQGAQGQGQNPKYPLVSYSGHIYGQGGHYRPSVFAQSREEEEGGEGGEEGEEET